MICTLMVDPTIILERIDDIFGGVREDLVVMIGKYFTILIPHYKNWQGVA